MYTEFLSKLSRRLESELPVLVVSNSRTALFGLYTFFTGDVALEHIYGERRSTKIDADRAAAEKAETDRGRVKGGSSIIDGLGGRVKIIEVNTNDQVKGAVSSNPDLHFTHMCGFPNAPDETDEDYILVDNPEVKLLMYSPTIGNAVDFNCDHFGGIVFALSIGGSTTSREFRQQVERHRNSSVIIYHHDKGPRKTKLVAEGHDDQVGAQERRLDADGASVMARKELSTLEQIGVHNAQERATSHNNYVTDFVRFVEMDGGNHEMDKSSWAKDGDENIARSQCDIFQSGKS